MTVKYAYQYDDIGNRITSFDLGTNRKYTANNLNQYTLVSNLCDSASLRETFIPQFDAVKRYGNVYYTELNCIEWKIVYGVRLDAKGNKEEYFEAH